MVRDAVGPFELEVLATLLEHPRDAYGITIMDRMEVRTGRTPNLGAIYKALDRLEEKGMVSSRWGEPTAQRGGRRKRYYAISAFGQKAVQNSVDLAPTFDKPRLAGA